MSTPPKSICGKVKKGSNEEDKKNGGQQEEAST